MNEQPSMSTGTIVPQGGAGLPIGLAPRSKGLKASSSLAVAASALILIWNASRLTFFDDESFSLRRYIQPMGEMVSALYHGVEPDPPLYYIIETAWIGVVGVSSPLLMRIPSIVFFIAGLVVIRRAGAAWFGESTGRVAQLLAALHPAHLLFGMAARWYGLMFLGVVALLWMTAIASRSGPRRALRLIGWSIVAAAVCYTNYFGVVVVGLAWIAGCLASRGCFWNSIEAESREQSRVSSATRPWRAVLSPVSNEKPVYDQSTRAADRREDTPALIGAACGANRASEWQRWLLAGLAAAALYSPWATAFYRQLMIFPRAGGGVSAYLSATGRTVLALTSGNLASPAAWWVQIPLAVFVLIVVILTLREIHRVWPLALIAGGSIVAGIASQTMLDKYVLSLSGAVCVLVARVVAGTRGSGRARFNWLLGRTAWTCLCIAWIGCVVHLVTGRYWSSLRWLDPFDDAATAAVSSTMGGGGSIVASHPAAAYYLARSLADIARPDGGGPRAPEASKRAYLDEFSKRLTPSDRPPAVGERLPIVLSPTGALAALESGNRAPSRFVVVESAEFQGDAAWAALREQLNERYALSNHRTFLPDPDAALKDRLDPRFKHPRFRIEVSTWDLKPTR